MGVGREQTDKESPNHQSQHGPSSICCYADLSKQNMHPLVTPWFLPVPKHALLGPPGPWPRCPHAKTCRAWSNVGSLCSTSEPPLCSLLFMYFPAKKMQTLLLLQKRCDPTMCVAKGVSVFGASDRNSESNTPARMWFLWYFLFRNRAAVVNLFRTQSSWGTSFSEIPRSMGMIHLLQRHGARAFLLRKESSCGTSYKEMEPLWYFILRKATTIFASLPRTSHVDTLRISRGYALRT